MSDVGCPFTWNSTLVRPPSPTHVNPFIHTSTRLTLVGSSSHCALIVVHHLSGVEVRSVCDRQTDFIRSRFVAQLNMSSVFENGANRGANGSEPAGTETGEFRGVELKVL